MNAQRALPADYRLSWSLDLRANRALLIGMNAAAVVLFLPGALLAGWLLRSLDPQAKSPWALLQPPGPILVNMLAYLTAGILVIILHEVIHGLFFWLVTRERPSFGLRSGYAFAAAPGWYIRRGAYLWIGISPLVIITAGGLLLSPLLPTPLLYACLFGMLLNATGSLGDVLVVFKLLRQDRELLVCDHGDKIEAYSRVSGDDIDAKL